VLVAVVECVVAEDPIEQTLVVRAAAGCAVAPAAGSPGGLMIVLTIVVPAAAESAVAPAAGSPGALMTVLMIVVSALAESAVVPAAGSPGALMIVPMIAVSAPAEYAVALAAGFPGELTIVSTNAALAPVVCVAALAEGFLAAWPAAGSSGSFACLPAGLMVQKFAGVAVYWFAYPGENWVCPAGWKFPELFQSLHEPQLPPPDEQGRGSRFLSQACIR